MLKLDNTLLDQLGLGALSEEQKKAMLQHIYETLELRVGTDLANQMSDQQLEEFEKFIDDGGEANQSQALQWLESNLPNYKDVVNRVFEELKAEIKNMAPQILATSLPAQPQQVADPGMYPPASMPGQQAAPGYAQPNVSVQPQPFPQQPSVMSGAPQHPHGTQHGQQQPFPGQQPPAGPGSAQQPPRPQQ
jgi:hypothetical protein